MTVSTVKNLSPDKQVGDFCDFLYESQNGYAYLPTKNEEGSSEVWSPYFFKWPAQKDQLVRHVLTMSKVKDVYIAPSLFSKPSALIENVIGTHVLWADFDGNCPTSKDLADANVPEPTLRIQSSPGKQHLWWKLDEFTTDIKTVQDINRAIAYETGADPSGWDMNQVLRPVCSINHKREDKTAVVILSGNTSIKYSAEEFSKIPVPERMLDKVPLLNGIVPVASRVIAKYPFTDKEMDLLLHPKILDGHRAQSLSALGHLLCEKGLHDAEIYSLIKWVDSRWKKFSERNDAEKRYLSLLSYLRFKHPKTSSLDIKEEANVGIHLQFLGYRELLSHTDSQKYFIEPKILPDRGFLYIAGRAGVGKSNLSTELAFKLIFNENYLDWTFPEQEDRHVVLHLQLEMGTTEQKEVALKMDEQFTEEQRDILQEHYKIVCIQDAFKLYNAVHVAMLEEAVVHYQPTVVVIDSSSVSFAPALKDDEEKIRLSATNLYKLRQTYNFSTVVVGHAKKNSSKEDGLDANYGMSVLEQYLSTGILLTQDKKATDELRTMGDDDTQVIELTVTKHRFGSDVGKSYPLHIKSNPLRFVRPAHVLPPLSKAIELPSQRNIEAVTDAESILDEVRNKFGI